MRGKSFELQVLSTAYAYVSPHSTESMSYVLIVYSISVEITILSLN